MGAFHQILRWVTFGFPLWALIASVLALYDPGLFTWFSGNLITLGLGAIMLSMGITLQLDDFRRVAKRPQLIALGIALQYMVMPLMGWGVAWIMDLPTAFAVGLILVSCCPGGVASNVISYLAMADVPLSVSLTAVSTSLSVLMTPLLTAILASSRVEVPAGGLLLSTVQVVIIPIVLGLTLRRYAPLLTHVVLPVAPLISVLLITLIVASIIGASRSQILEFGTQLAVSVFLLHAGGFILGYFLTRLLAGAGGVIQARTVSVEVGMQNSGLGVVLAGENFPDPLVAVPSAISSLFHSLIGSVLAAFWRMTAESHGRAGSAEID